MTAPVDLQWRELIRGWRVRRQLSQLQWPPRRCLHPPPRELSVDTGRSKAHPHHDRALATHSRCPWGAEPTASRRRLRPPITGGAWMHRAVGRQPRWQLCSTPFCPTLRSSSRPGVGHRRPQRRGLVADGGPAFFLLFFFFFVFSRAPVEHTRSTPSAWRSTRWTAHRRICNLDSGAPTSSGKSVTGTAHRGPAPPRSSLPRSRPSPGMMAAAGAERGRHPARVHHRRPHRCASSESPPAVESALDVTVDEKNTAVEAFYPAG
jgi:hypothetical protein